MDKYIDDLIAVKTNNHYLSVINTANFGQSIYVTNSVYYGKWLNDGGYLDPTYTKSSHPNRFIEQCLDHIEQNNGKLEKPVFYLVNQNNELAMALGIIMPYSFATEEEQAKSRIL